VQIDEHVKNVLNNTHMLRILKIGGASITNKSTHETLNEPALSSLLQMLKASVVDDGETIIIHGAGSFGHFEAKEYSVSAGFKNSVNKSLVIEGISKTRRSVTKLNAIFVSKLIDAGIPAVGVSPFGTWTTRDGKVIKHNVGELQAVLDAGLVPVLHGDVVMD